MTEISFGRNLSAWAASNPDDVVITHNDEVWTADAFHRWTNRLARIYVEHGVRHNDMVTIALPNGAEFFAACFAAWKAGATPQPVSSRLPRVERDAIISVANSALVVGADDTSPNGAPVLPIGYRPPSDMDDSDLPDIIADHWKALSSGGSTGRPKLIVDASPARYDFDAATMNGREINLLLQRPCETHLVVGPLYHNAPFAFAMHAFLRRNHIVIADRFDAEDTLRLIEQHRANWMMMVPTMMHRIWRLPASVRDSYDLSSLRLMLHIAAPCPVWLKEAWIDWLGPERILELMGGTEGTGVTSITGQEWLEHRGSVGKLQPGSTMKIVRDDGSDAAVGEIGEVFFLPDSGQGSTYQYLGAEAKAIDGGWESLGDMGYVDEEGYLYLTDRRTDMILAGGANIYPAEIEAAIELFPGVRSCVVIGLPDADLGNRVHAIIDAPDGIDESSLVTFLSERLVRYKIPRSFEHTDDGPLRDDAGKVRRTQLRAVRIAQEKIGDT